MNRVATYLEQSPVEDVLVLTPHDPQVPEPAVKGWTEYPSLVPEAYHFALIGKNDYVMGAPLAKASSD